MREALRTILRWTAGWTIVGLIGGVAIMFAKVPLIAEPGAQSEGVWSFAFWIPMFGVAGGVVGFATGCLFSILMMLLFRDGSQKVAARSGAVGKYAPGILCGTIAGTLAGLFFIRVDHDAPFVFAGLGCCSGAVSSFMQSRVWKSKERSSAPNV